MTSPDPVPVTTEVLRRMPLPAPGDDKRSRGEVLVAGGSASTPGAVVLAGTAALRAGAGKLRIATVASTSAAIGVAVPEAGVEGLTEARGELSPECAEQVLAATGRTDTVLLGSGIGDVDAAAAWLERLVPRLEIPTVVDALGSAYLTQRPDGLHHLEGRAVLTLNPVELARTLGRDEEAVGEDPADAALAAATRCRAVVLCGGPEKHVATPDGDVWVVDGGGPGLGVSGSGDVQAGIVAGLLARGCDPARAAVWGAWAHARAGERLAATVAEVGFLARELPAQVPVVLAEASAPDV